MVTENSVFAVPGKQLQNRAAKTAAILEYVRQNPEATVERIAAATHSSRRLVYAVLKEAGIVRWDPPKGEKAQLILEYYTEHPGTTIKGIADYAHVSRRYVCETLEREGFRVPGIKEELHAYLFAHPEETNSEIAAATGASMRTICVMREQVSCEEKISQIAREMCAYLDKYPGASVTVVADELGYPRKEVAKLWRIMRIRDHYNPGNIVRTYKMNHPDATAREIVQATHYTFNTVYKELRKIRAMEEEGRKE